MLERSLFPLHTRKETKRPQDDTHTHTHTHERDLEATCPQPQKDVKLQLLGGKNINEINTSKTRVSITDAR